MTLNIFQIIDRLAGIWLDWRTEQFVKNDPELSEMSLHRLEKNETGAEVTIISPAVAHMADAMSELLTDNNAKNFISFEMLPRLDRGKRPILVTVQYRDGKSPADSRDQIIMTARELIDYFENNIMNFQYEKMKSYVFELKCLCYPPYTKTNEKQDGIEASPAP